MTYEQLIDVEAVKERFMGNYQMFSMYLYQFAEGGVFHDLEAALKAGDIAGAFDVAHDMKGVVLNLSLKPLEQPMRSVVEPLREGRLPDKATWDVFAAAYEKTVENIEKLKKGGEDAGLEAWGKV